MKEILEYIDINLAQPMIKTGWFSRMRRPFILIVFGLLVGLIIYQNIAAHNKKAAMNEANMPLHAVSEAQSLAPSFTLQGLDGQSYNVGGKRDKPLLLNFWASWCEPCQAEAPDLKRMYEQYKGKLDLYSVNITNKDSLKAAKSFVKRFDLAFPVLMDKAGKATELYRVAFYPTSYIIDRNGVITSTFNIVDAKELESIIKKAISAN